MDKETKLCIFAIAIILTLAMLSFLGNFLGQLADKHYRKRIADLKDYKRIDKNYISDLEAEKADLVKELKSTQSMLDIASEENGRLRVEYAVAESKTKTVCAYVQSKGLDNEFLSFAEKYLADSTKKYDDKISRKRVQWVGK